MSQSDVERFVADLKANAEMRGELQGEATGVESVVSFAKGKGYDISADEARDYIRSQSQSDLSDAQLDAIAGGKGSHGSHTGPTTTVTAQTVAVTSTEAAAVETTAATTAEVAALAVAVIVLT